MTGNSLYRRLRIGLDQWFKPRGKYGFIASLLPETRLLDVGCGNNSPMMSWLQRPDISYFGMDIAPGPGVELAVSADKFAFAIEQMPDAFDAVISSHNIEHCLDPDATLVAMLRSLKSGGRIFMAFPCGESVSFPRRPKGGLNFNDDGTHLNCPDADKVFSIIKAQGFVIEFLARRYRPVILAVMGLMLEPLGFLLGRAMPLDSTWALYGFETIIWARKADA